MTSSNGSSRGGDPSKAQVGEVQEQGGCRTTSARQRTGTREEVIADKQQQVLDSGVAHGGDEQLVMEGDVQGLHAVSAQHRLDSRPGTACSVSKVRGDRGYRCVKEPLLWFLYIGWYFAIVLTGLVTA